MANNINQIKATIEANLAAIEAAFYKELAANPTAEGTATARANYAAALEAARLNAQVLLNNQTPLTQEEYTIYNFSLRMGVTNPFIDAVDDVTSTKSAKPVTKKDCIALFNKYLDLIRKMQKLLESVVALKNMLQVKYYIYGENPTEAPDKWIVDPLGKNPVVCWLACEMNEWVKKNPNTDNGFGGVYRERDMPGFFHDGEDCWQYINDPGNAFLLRLRRERGFGKTMPLPFQLPSFPPELLPDWIPRPNSLNWDDPNVISEWLKKMRQFLKDVQTNPSQVKPNSDCYDLYKEAVDWIAERVGIILQFLSLGEQLQKTYEEMANGPCNGILQLDELLRNRNIGRFQNPTQFGQWIWQLHQKELVPMPNLDPMVDLLSTVTVPSETADKLNQWAENVVYKNDPNRYQTALSEYNKWEAQPKETRSLVPPMKWMFPVLNDPYFTDEFAFMYLAGMVWSRQMQQESNSIYKFTHKNLSSYAKECSILLSIYQKPDITTDQSINNTE